MGESGENATTMGQVDLRRAIYHREGGLDKCYPEACSNSSGALIGGTVAVPDCLRLQSAELTLLN